ncbi:MAG: type VI secretion system-associated protein TagF [Pseudomonadota bacterium]|nr:type VI secretion system-associated protein TagF [Pseudomonadota bacterium]
MSRAAPQERIGYFGKLPARSDFIKLAPDTGLMGVLDDWLAEVMSRLPDQARWKQHYDTLAPLSFAFVGPRRHHAVAGHIVASCDQAGRRFPFLLMRTLEVGDPAAFVTHAPLVLAPLFGYFTTMAAKVRAATDPAAALQEIADAALPLDEQCGPALAAFMETGTIASLAALLGRADVRELILALGLLLQPVMAIGAADIEKSLVLPLPQAAGARAAVAAFWMALIAPFLRLADLDLVLFVTDIDAQPALVVGFCDACVHSLHAIIDPLVGRRQLVRFADTGWVHDQLGVDVDVRALASYLEQPQLPLTLARDLFLDTFIGADL